MKTIADYSPNGTKEAIKLNILHEVNGYYVTNERSKKDPAYHVWAPGVTHSTCDSAYRDITLAVCRCNYLANRIKPALTVPALANAFSQKLRNKLSAKVIGLIIALNEAEADPQICHTHDFIDANEVMNEAYKSITGQNFEPFLASGDFASDLPIWNEAWALAKEHKFNTIN